MSSSRVANLSNWPSRSFIIGLLWFWFRMHTRSVRLQTPHYSTEDERSIAATRCVLQSRDEFNNTSCLWSCDFRPTANCYEYARQYHSLRVICQRRSRKHSGVFKTVDEVCFDKHTFSCHTTSCDESPIIRCSWCEKSLCFNHFL